MKRKHEYLKNNKIGHQNNKIRNKIINNYYISSNDYGIIIITTHYNNNNDTFFEVIGRQLM